MLSTISLPHSFHYHQLHINYTITIPTPPHHTPPALNPPPPSPIIETNLQLVWCRNVSNTSGGVSHEERCGYIPYTHPHSLTPSLPYPLTPSPSRMVPFLIETYPTSYGEGGRDRGGSGEGVREGGGREGGREGDVCREAKRYE